MFIFRGAHVGQPLMKIRSPPAKLRQRITDRFLIVFRHAASITKSLLRADCAWLGFFGKVYWPTPFNIYLDFRPLLRRTFAELSRKYPYSQTPAISRGRIEGKVNTRGLGDWLSQSLTFAKLGCCIWSLFLETSKSIIRRWQRQVPRCASGPWCLAVAKPHLWKLGCYLWRARRLSKSTTTQGTEPEPNRNSLVPFSCRTHAQWVAALYIMIIIISNFRETLARKKCYFRELEKNFGGGFQHNMHGFRH